jgi:Uncharacterized protein containing SIS (Sugar ISomerase) phosphosugar binding domain
MNSRYIETAIAMLEKLDETQYDNIKKAAEIVADSIMAGGILISFGSGHSIVGAKEIHSRAGGLFPTKQIIDPTGGIFEKLEGSGTELVRKVEMLPEDVVIIISNSGRNPISVEIALKAKECGSKIIAVTALESSKKLTPRHSSGKMLYELADVVLDLCSVEGDAAIEVEGLDEKICGTSTVTTAAVLQSMILEAVELMISRGFTPPVRISANLDNGSERSAEIEKQYAHRIYRI